MRKQRCMQQGRFVKVGCHRICNRPSLGRSTILRNGSAPREPTAFFRNCVAFSGGTEGVSSRLVPLRAHAQLLADLLPSSRGHRLLAAFHREDKPAQHTLSTLQVSFCNRNPVEQLVIWTSEQPDISCS